MFRFKEENSLAKRSSESLKILSKWPDKVPIIMEKSANSRVEDFPKNKFLCPADYSVHQFLSSVRKKINVGKDTALFVFMTVNRVTSPAIISEFAILTHTKSV